jgi:hypothetical protein
MHPSGFEAKGDTTSTEPDQEYPNKYRPINDHQKLFNNDNLFEVVVMYLFNGLKNQVHTHVPSTKPSTPGRDGCTNLIHYMAYMVPEFDKAYIVDFDAHPEHHDRLRHIRVIFDQTDYRFRVIINAHFKNQQGQEGWSDISEALRMKFAAVSNNVARTFKGDLQYAWTTLVSEFRIVLIAKIMELMKLDEKDKNQGWERVTRWMMKPEDIAWETTGFGLTSSVQEDWLENLKNAEHYKDNLHHLQKKIEDHPFIMSYWADNYLELDSYKVARMFSGLVGYGEYVYNRTNNYTKLSTNNLYSDMGDGKIWWIWHDLPKFSGLRDADLHTLKDSDVSLHTENRSYMRERTPVLSAINPIPAQDASVSSDPKQPTRKPENCIEFCYLVRKSLLQCVVWYSDFYVPDSFLLLIQRRHDRVRREVFSDAIRALKKYGKKLLDETVEDLFVPGDHLIGEAPGTVVADISIWEKYYNRVVSAWYEKDKIIYESPAGTTAHIDATWMDTEIHEIIEEMGEELNNLHKNFRDANTLFDAKDEDRTEYKKLQKQLRSTFATVIHMSREKWLLDKHTKNIKFINLEAIQITKPIRWEERNDRKRISNSSFYMSKNNSDLCRVYRDLAVGTYSPGYVHAAERADIVCARYQCKLRSQILQGYYDRKMNRNNAMTKFVETQDLTSIFRSTQGLVRGLKELTKRIAGQSNNSLAQIQPSRTDYSPHGKYWVLGAKHGIHGTRFINSNESGDNTIEEGMRDIHCDDVVTFSSILSEVIDNPGMWNLVTTKTLSNTRTDSDGNEDEQEKDCLQVANSGFVIHGQKVVNAEGSYAQQEGENDDTRSSDSLSWNDIFQMTYEKLRVGILDQPNFSNTGRYYQNEVINSTRRLSTRNAHEGFAFCMKKIYNSVAFGSILIDTSVPINLLKKEIENESRICVQDLIRSCVDAGLNLARDHEDYAFPQMKRYNIIMHDTPKEKENEKEIADLDELENFHTDPEYNEDEVTVIRGHKRLFYILFGELMFSMINDLETTPMTQDNAPQIVQKETNKAIATYYKDQMKMFLANLTIGFFSGTLHHNLAVQLHKDNTLPDVGEPVLNTDLIQEQPHPYQTEFEALIDRLEETCATAHTHKVNTQVWRDLPLQSYQQDKQIQVQEHVIKLVKTMYTHASHPYLDQSQHRAFQRCFLPHIEIYKRLKIFKDAGEDYRRNAQNVHVPSPEPVNDNNASAEDGMPSVSAVTEQSEEQQRVTFCENRMLVMRICEEQMHIMERGYNKDKEFYQSFTWKILMYMFMEMRQFFAHQRFIRNTRLNVHATPWPAVAVEE